MGTWTVPVAWTTGRQCRRQPVRAACQGLYGCEVAVSVDHAAANVVLVAALALGLIPIVQCLWYLVALNLCY